VSARSAYRGSTYVLSGAMIVVGIALLVRTAFAGASGIAVGYLIGGGLLAAGILRLALLRRTGA